MSIKNDRKGFSLVEVLLAVAVFSILALGLSSSLVYGRQSIESNGRRNRAIALAEEGLSAVRSIRDSSFDTLADGTYGIQNTGGQWTLTGSSDTVDIFTRSVSISSISANEKLISSNVEWPQSLQRTGDYTAETVLTNWQEPQTAGVFRVTEYYISGVETGTSHNLQLNQALAPDYFVLIRGAEGDDGNGGTYGPDATYASVSADPFGTGDLDNTSNPSTLRIRRGSSGGSALWRGVVTVVECTDDCNNNGFRLLDVNIVQHSGSSASGSDNSVAWSDINKVQLVGGYRGAGCYTIESSASRFPNCHTRIFPSGTNTINWQRPSSGTSLTAAESTVMTVQWGSSWNVQRRTISGTNGGNGADEITEYNNAAITPVVRANTWVWGTGYTDDNGIGDGAEGSLITLGNGVVVSPTESLLSVGQEYNDYKNFEVYAISHPQLSVFYSFKPDGNSGDLTYAANTATVPSSRARMAIVSNGQNGTGVAYPRPVFSARYSASNTITVERRRSGQPWPAWIHGVDFSALSLDTVPPAAVTTLSASNPTNTSIGLSWNAPGDDGAIGTAQSYDLRYSTSPITNASWNTATPAVGEPTPTLAGSNQSMTVSGLLPNTTYYFAIKSTDEAGNISALSNIANATTTAVVASQMADSLQIFTLGASLCCGDKQWDGWTLLNTGPSAIIIDAVQVTWTGGDADELRRVDLGGSKKYDGKTSNGATANIDNTSIGPFGVLSNNYLRWDDEIEDAVFSVRFIMTDGSSKTISGLSYD